MLDERGEHVTGRSEAWRLFDATVADSLDGPTAKSTAEAVAPPQISGEDIALAETIKELENSFQARKTSFEPAVEDTYERSLVSLNNSIREARDSVKEEPGNALAREYLVAAYEQKAEVLSAALEYDGR